ncbi:MAG: ABC transporter permease subunit [Oscillospiraceae bacterium]|nr:ABC transporter permease subunit [Oscillospiraceae bacterium]
MNVNWRKLAQQIWRDRLIYFLLLPGVVFFIIFNYIPMYGITLAFKKYMVGDGILGSPWIGFSNFEKLFKLPDFWRAFTNTIVISLQRLVFEFPVPIILALLLNEVRRNIPKRFMQTVFTFPNFLSWIVVAGLTFNILADNGLVNVILVTLGHEKQSLLTTPSFFRPLLYFTSNWKSAGWVAIIYLASITSINYELYEAAVIDGANRFKQTIYVTWPGIRSTVAIMFILAIGNTMNAGFDQIFNLYNPVVYDVADIMETYIYRRAFSTGSDFGAATAVTLFRAVINFTLLLLANFVVRFIGEEGLF